VRQIVLRGKRRAGGPALSQARQSRLKQPNGVVATTPPGLTPKVVPLSPKAGKYASTAHGPSRSRPGAAPSTAIRPWSDAIPSCKLIDHRADSRCAARSLPSPEP
jgi:hypothetical protein